MRKTWLVAAMAAAFCGQAAGAAPAYAIKTLSTRADAVSGGDVLVSVTAPLAEKIAVSLNGSDVTGAFHSVDGGAMTGLVEGLRLGRNTLALSAGGRTRASLTVVDYPIEGPIFSGPHERPYVCETVQSGLGPARDADCTVATTYRWFYKPAGGGAFKPLTDPAHPPADVATAKIYGGASVPYIVRVESGTIDRAIYHIAILADPAAPQGADFRPGPGWNGKLRYDFGGGCGFGHHQGTMKPEAVLDDINLSRGFAVATSTANVYGQACNDVKSAETLLMVKEHFIERYGLPRYTMGIGGSGGAMQQLLISQNYPGILDGIVPGIAFPDGQTLTHTPTDCDLLIRYLDGAEGWTDAQKLAVSGFKVKGSCLDPKHNWGGQRLGGTNSIHPANCGKTFPAEMIWNPISNPRGVRCTVYEGMKNLYGPSADRQQPLDNVGVQYGLRVLRAGGITVDQFLDLNEKIGGFDADGFKVPHRTSIGLDVMRRSYATGRVFNGKGVALPIIQNRSYLDDGNGNVHTDWHSLEVRERLRRANGGKADNEVIWIAANDKAVADQVAADITDVMDQWLEALLADASDAPYAIKVARAKPVHAVDACYDLKGVRYEAPIGWDNAGKCGELFPHSANMRVVAGEPIQEDVIKCRLKPADPASYGVAFTPGQAARLKRVFPTGVCDYTRPGVGQVAVTGPWLSYGPAPRLASPGRAERDPG